MDLGSILVIFAVVILVSLFVSRPFLKQEPPAEQTTDYEHQRSALLAERDQALNAIQELDFDFTLGKIPEEEYPGTRAMLLSQGADALRKLDELEKQNPEIEAEKRIEAAIAARRMAGHQAPQPEILTANDQVEALISTRRQHVKEHSAGFCPRCGKPVQESDVFCPKCGTPLTTQ